MTDAAKRGLHGDVKHVVWKHFHANDESSEELTFSPLGLLLEHKSDYGDRTASTVNEYDGTGRLIAIRGSNSEGTDLRREVRYDSEGEMLGPGVLSVTYSHGSGRKLKTEMFTAGKMRNAGFGDSSTFFSLAQNCTAASTVYDAFDRPVEKVYYNAEHLLLAKLVRTYDMKGQVRTESIIPTADGMGSIIDKQLPPGIGAVFASAMSSQRSYVYDEHGRVVEETQDIGELSHERTVREYNEHGDIKRELHYSQSREGRLNETGRIEIPPEAPPETVTETLRRYEYDPRGNWTLQELTTPPADAITREIRTIEYFS